jgi:6-phosphogluconolactonase (cycloisomerase 2 family)
MQPCNRLLLATGTCFTILVSACGDAGSGSGNTPAASSQVTGTVAYGRPVVGRSIQALDSSGALCATATTASDGSYSVDTSGCAPGAIAFHVAAYTTPGGSALDAVALPARGSSGVSGVVNINPLTTLLAYYAAGLVPSAKAPASNDQVLALLPQVSAAEYHQAMTSVLTAALLQKLQSGYGMTTTGFDPTTTAFVANGQGLDGFFDAYPLSASGNSVQISAPSAPGPLVQVTLPVAPGASSTVTSTASYSVGGTVSGLSGGTLGLLLNGSHPFSVTTNGAFVFPAQASSTYAVTVGTQPTAQVCTVSNGSGAGLTANVSGVNIVCAAETFTIGGTVSNLVNGTQVVLDDNGSDPVVVAANGAFTFASPLAFGGGYSVTVGTQATGQTCSVSNGSGTNVASDVSTVSVICSVNPYTIGGSVTGLAGGVQLTLDNNGADPTVITANTAFTFPTPVAENASYAVTVGTQPNGQSCTVSNGSGSGVSANVVNVSVACVTNPVYVYVGNYGSNNVLGYSHDPSSGATNNIAGGPFAAGTYDRWVTANPAGTLVLAANQNSHNVSAYSVAASTGTLSPVAGSPFDTGGSVPVFVGINAAGTFAYVANAGSANITVFRIDPGSSALSAIAGSPFAAGGSPAAVAIHPAGTFAYVANAGDNTISGYAINPSTGALTPLAGSPYANAANVGSIRSITVNAAGTLAYGANGWGTISGFSIDPTSGALTALGGSPFATGAGGATWIEVGPTGNFAYLATGNGGYVMTFSLDPTSGAPTQIAGGSCGAAPNATGVNYIKFNPAGTYAYMANGWVLDVAVCSVDPTSGALNDVAGSPFGVGARPLGIGVVQH